MWSVRSVARAVGDGWGGVSRVQTLLVRRGTCLGTGECGISWWALRGHVYCCLSSTRLDWCGSRADFERRVARGGLPGFQRRKGR